MRVKFGFYRRVKRYRQITRVVLKHGLGHLFNAAGFNKLIPFTGRKNRQIVHESPAKRLRHALWELGPTFIKLGQFLSTRADILPEEYVRELAKLQDTVPPASLDEVRRTIEKEFGRPMEEVFTFFAPEPLGSASIAQVHEARLSSGEGVVVKVRRAGVREMIAVDIEILRDIARFAEKHTTWGRVYPLDDMVGEFQQALKKETDFTIEAQHAETFRHNLAGDEAVVIPRIFWGCCKPGVLVLERVRGIKISDFEALDKQGFDRRGLARRLAKTILQQMLLDGFFHGDPHPGNIYVLPGEKLAFVDFGIVGHLSPTLKEQVGWLVVGLTQKNAEIVSRIVLQMQLTSELTNLAALKRDIDILQQKYYEVPISLINLSEAFSDVLRVAYRHRLRVPAELTLLVKTLTSADGLIRRLDPEISIAEIAVPIGRKFITTRFGADALRQFILNELPTHLFLLTRLPAQITGLLESAARGELRFIQENPDLRKLTDRLDKNLAKLILGLLAVTFSVAAFLLVGKDIHFFNLLPAGETALLGAVIFLGVLLLRK